MPIDLNEHLKRKNANNNNSNNGGNGDKKPPKNPLKMNFNPNFNMPSNKTIIGIISIIVVLLILDVFPDAQEYRSMRKISQRCN